MSQNHPYRYWSRRQILLGGTAAGLAAGIGSPLLHSPASAAAGNGARPNIIWIMADDLGFADVSFTGQRAFVTPNMDRIAREGLFLRQSYSNSAVCSATRTGLITGRYQYRLRVGLEEPLAAPSDGLNLLDVVTGRGPVNSRSLYWRYKASEQAALRDGDWKYLKIGKNEQLFNLAADERERANHATRDPARFAAMKQQWAAWNATMLPYPTESYSHPNTAVDRY